VYPVHSKSGRERGGEGGEEREEVRVAKRKRR
jgi:hypothetical protein